ILVLLDEKDGYYRADRFLRASDLADNLGQDNNPEWKTIAVDGSTGELVSPLGSIGYRWGEKGKWNIESREGKEGREVDLQLSQIGSGESVDVGFPYFGGQLHEHFTAVEGEDVQARRVPVRSLTLADGKAVKVATVFDLMAANLAIRSEERR